MEINVIASSKLGYVAPKENLDKFAGLTAGICYLPATTDKLFSENEEKTFKRVNMIKESGHLSPFDHANITLELIDVPKIIAMILNDEQFYTASEKSARYKKMNCEGDEKEAYDKWLEIFKIEIAKQYQSTYPEYFTDKKIEKLAQENARYLTSVFTPTTMAYTVSYRQLNKIYAMINKEIEILADNQDPFAKRLAHGLIIFSSELEKLPYLDEKLQETKNRGLSIFDYSKKPIIKQYGEYYNLSYLGSFAQFAQAQRHRTLEYKIKFDGEHYGYYLPPILKQNKILSLMWQQDCEKLAQKFPQGTLVKIVEGGKVERLIEKAKERKCTLAQLEINNQTTATLQEVYQELQKIEHPLTEEIAQYAKNSSRCTFKDYTCKQPCHFKEGITGERII